MNRRARRFADSERAAEGRELQKQQRDLKEIISALRGISGTTSGHVRDLSIYDHEKQLIEEALYRAHGNQSEAAKILKVSRDQVRYRMAKYRIKQ